MENELGVQRRLIEMFPESLISWVGDNLLLTFVLVLGIGGFTIFMLIIFLSKKFSTMRNEKTPNVLATVFSFD